MAPQIGQKAPDFRLPDLDKNFVELNNFRGKNIVLFFFPMAWTGACTKEMCTIQEDFNAYTKLNAVPIGISVDSIFALKKFKEELKLNDIIFLSDFNKEAINAYDIVANNFVAGFNGVAMRSTFVIDKEGVLRYIEVLKAQGDQPNMDAIKNALAGLK